MSQDDAPTAAGDLMAKQLGLAGEVVEAEYRAHPDSTCSSLVAAARFALVTDSALA